MDVADKWSGAEIYSSELVKGSEEALLNRLAMHEMANECARVNDARRKGAEEAMRLGRQARRHQQQQQANAGGEAAGSDEEDEDADDSAAADDSAIEESMMDAAALASKRLRSAKKKPPSRATTKKQKLEVEEDPDRTLVEVDDEVLKEVEDDGGKHSATSGLSMSEYLDLGFGEDAAATTGDYFAVKEAPLAPAPELFKTPAKITSTKRVTSSTSQAVAVSPASTTLRIPYLNLANWYSARFGSLQQMTCKLVLKAWIKVVEPKKQSKHPYNRGEEGKPVWWPDEVRHKEPDHLMKPERAQLLLALVRSPLVPVSKLELATAENSTYIPQNKMRILREVYRVAKEEERRRGTAEEWNDIELHVPVSPPSTLASKAVSTVNRETRAIQAAGADSPTQMKKPVTKKRPRSDSQQSKAVVSTPLFPPLSSTPLRPMDVNASMPPPPPTWYAPVPALTWSAPPGQLLPGVLPTRGRMSHATAARHAMHHQPPQPQNLAPIPIGQVALPAWPPYPPTPMSHQQAAFFEPPQQPNMYPPTTMSFQAGGGDFHFQS